MAETVTIRPARASELPAVGAIAAAALHRDPMWAFLVPDPRRRPVVLAAFYEILAGHAYTRGGAVDLVTDTACAIWIPSMSLPDLSTDRLRAVCRGDTAAFDQLTAVVSAIHPEEAHNYLALLAVAPATARRGTGGALLRHHFTLMITNHTGTYATATTSHAARLLARHGFAEHSEPLTAGTVHLRPMWRPAGSTTG